MADKEQDKGGMKLIQPQAPGGGGADTGLDLDFDKQFDLPDAEAAIDKAEQALQMAEKERKRQEAEKEEIRERKRKMECCGLYW